METISPLGFRTTYTYYSTGKTKEVKNAENQVTTSTYYADDLTKEQIDARGGRTTTTYDNANRQRAVFAADGLVTTYTYYPDGMLKTITAPPNRVSTYSYDNANRQTAVTNPNGETSQSTYYPDGQLKEAITPLGYRTTHVYDKANRPTELIDAEGRRTTTTYDDAGRAIEVRDARGCRTTTTYDNADRRIALQNGRGYRTTWTYDHNSRVTSETDALGRLTTYTYTPLGQLDTKMDARVVVVTFSYDDDRRLTGHQYSDGTRFTFTYDKVANQTLMHDSTGRTTFTYDNLNRTDMVTNAAGRVVTYAYDPVGRRTGMKDPDGGFFTYHYDNAGRLDYLVNPQSERTTFSYDPADRLLVKQLANGTRTTHIYDADSRLTRIDHVKSDGAVLDRLTYAYNNVGVRTSLTDVFGNVTTWTYDETYQLTGQLRSGVANLDWATFTLDEWVGMTLEGWVSFELNPWEANYTISDTYDCVGNRTVGVNGATITTYTYDAANQLQTSQDTAGVTNYTYDAAGNLQVIQAPAGARTTYTWSADNRQTKVELPTSEVTTNTYRADGLRHQKQDSTGTTRFVYDGQAYLAETDATNATQAQYTNEPTTYGSLASQRRKSGAAWTPSYYHFDATGNTRGLTGADQSVLASYLQTAFGEQLLNFGVINPFRFIGKLGYYLDVATNTFNVRQRSYLASLARWLSNDSVRDDQLNLFRYVLNSPLVFSDPSGLQHPPMAIMPDGSVRVMSGIDPDTEEGRRFLEQWRAGQRPSVGQRRILPHVHMRAPDGKIVFNDDAFRAQVVIDRQIAEAVRRAEQQRNLVARFFLGMGETVVVGGLLVVALGATAALSPVVAVVAAGSLLVYSVGPPIAYRIEAGQSAEQVALGTAGDITGASNAVAAALDRDVGTWEKLDLTDVERAERGGAAFGQLFLLGQGRQLGAKGFSSMSKIRAHFTPQPGQVPASFLEKTIGYEPYDPGVPTAKFPPNTLRTTVERYMGSESVGIKAQSGLPDNNSIGGFFGTFEHWSSRAAQSDFALQGRPLGYLKSPVPPGKYSFGFVEPQVGQAGGALEFFPIGKQSFGPATFHIYGDLNLIFLGNSISTSAYAGRGSSMNLAVPITDPR